MTDGQRYISGELTHFVGSRLESDEERYKCLKRILTEGCITYPPHDEDTRTTRELIVHYTKEISATTNEMFETKMVCFSDIPVGDLHIHTKKYTRFGLAFDKDFIARHGGGPVYYVPKYAAPVWARGEGATVKRGDILDLRAKECYHLLDDLICANNEWSERARAVQHFLHTDVFGYIRCFDHRLPDNDRHNYYFEREWRILGSLQFRLSDVSRILLPKEYARRFREDFPGYFRELIFF